MGTNMWKKYKIELLPIPELNKDNDSKINKIEDLVDKILTITSLNNYKENVEKLKQIKHIQESIDNLVYEFYGLDEKDRSIIEKGD